MKRSIWLLPFMLIGCQSAPLDDIQKMTGCPKGMTGAIDTKGNPIGGCEPIPDMEIVNTSTSGRGYWTPNLDGKCPTGLQKVYVEGHSECN